MLHVPSPPRPVEMGLCPNCCGNPLQRHTAVPARSLAHKSRLYEVLLWLCHSIILCCMFLQVKVLEITRGSRRSPVLMFLEHGAKHCLPWVIAWGSVRGYKTCQDNSGGLQKDWKKPHLSGSLLHAASWGTVATLTAPGEPGCSLQNRAWEQAGIHSVRVTGEAGPGSRTES